MALSSFSEKTEAPTDDDLRTTLGEAYEPWTKLLALVAERIDPITEVWEKAVAAAHTAKLSVRVREAR